MYILDGRESFYQWDINQKIKSNKFKVGDEVHFYNSKLTEALVVTAYELDGNVVADVPNILLQNAILFKAWVYVQNDGTAKTTYEHAFKVEQRAKPSDYVYEETEVLTITTAVNKALEDAKNSGEFDGEDGHTPVKGVDYWTDEDKDEIKAYIDEETEIIKSDIEGVQQQLNEEAHFRGYLSTNAKIQALEATPNDFAYSAESGTKWVYDVENGWQDTGTPVPDQLTPASDATPLINGTASAGTANEYARGDHRHPTDTTRVSVEEFNKFKIENAEIVDDKIANDRKLKLLKTITLEEDVAELNVEFDKPLDEIAILYNIAFTKDETARFATRGTNSGYLFYRSNLSLSTRMRYWYAHAKEVSERQWVCLISNEWFFNNDGLGDSMTQPRTTYLSRVGKPSRFIKNIDVFIPNNTSENAFVAGSTIQIWGHEADENL